jgi:purine-nucleoside phosphorylase
VRRVRERTHLEPAVAFVLGRSVPGPDDFQVEEELDVRDLLELAPHASGSGTPPLVLGRLGEVPVALLAGALRRHEGYSLSQATLPVRLMRLLGAPGREPPALLLGGVCDALHAFPGRPDLVMLDDHINLMAENPLVGPNLDPLGPRFPDMSQAYDAELRDLAANAARERRIPLGRGVYVALTGPQRPTRAESRMLRSLGADLTGNWVVPEVIVARHMGMRVLALLAVAAVLPGSTSGEPEEESPATRPTPAALRDLVGLLGEVCAAAARDRQA